MPLTSAVSARGARGVTDSGARAAGIDPRDQRRAHVIFVARRDAEPDHIDREVDTLLVHGRRHIERRKALGQTLGHSDFGKLAHVFLNRAAPKPGRRLTAMTTAKVMTSMMMPSTAMAPRSPELVEIEDQHRDHLGLRGEQDNGGGQFADHADEDEAPGGDHAGAQQRRRDVAERLQPRCAEDTACLLQVDAHRAERRLKLLVRGGQCDGDERDEQDPERAVKHEGWARVGKEQADAEYDTGHGDRRGRQEGERAPAGDRLARGEIGNHDRDDGADGGRQETKDERVLERELGGGQLEEHEIDVVQGEVLERDELRGGLRERRVEQRAVREDTPGSPARSGRAQAPPISTHRGG